VGVKGGWGGGVEMSGYDGARMACMMGKGGGRRFGEVRVGFGVWEGGFGASLG